MPWHGPSVPCPHIKVVACWLQLEQATSLEMVQFRRAQSGYIQHTQKLRVSSQRNWQALSDTARLINDGVEVEKGKLGPPRHLPAHSWLSCCRYQQLPCKKGHARGAKATGFQHAAAFPWHAKSNQLHIGHSLTGLSECQAGAF